MSGPFPVACPRCRSTLADYAKSCPWCGLRLVSEPAASNSSDGPLLAVLGLVAVLALPLVFAVRITPAGQVAAVDPSASPDDRRPPPTAVAIAPESPAPFVEPSPTHNSPSPSPSPRPSPRATEPTAATPLPADASAACTDDAYRLTGYYWTEPLQWYFASSTTPDAYDVDEVERILERSFANITDAINDCGRADAVSATAEYLGRLDVEACADEADGLNVVAFSRLGSTLLAQTCPWVVGSSWMAEADIVIDSDTIWQLSGECDFGFHLEGTMTHEVGHAFGLSHVGERRHGDLTMSPRTDYCDNGDATLGLGDMLALEELYPER